MRCGDGLGPQPGPCDGVAVRKTKAAAVADSGTAGLRDSMVIHSAIQAPQTCEVSGSGIQVTSE